jgi:tRNA-guanine transglycosylase, queuosine-34-forming
MAMDPIFEKLAADGATRARTGLLKLPHGELETPVFMPVGTNATVKAIEPEMLEEIGFGIILANTYHLYLRPGHDVVREAGGLHGFTGWKRNFLTDSGGFQIFSLAALRKLSEEGVRFRSHVDGAYKFITPEEAVEAQTSFNSDVQMQLDVCTPWDTPEHEASKASDLTTRWAKRAKARWLQKRDLGYQGSLFGIVQGNFYKNLRDRSAAEICELDLPGIAIGGLSVGEPFDVFSDLLAHTAALLPDGKPHYLMGIGTPDYILEAVENGIDMFDCVFPTRVARNGLLFTARGPIAIKKARYERDFGPVDPACGCRICRGDGRHSRAYLRHLYKCEEMLYATLASYHNLYFLNDLVLKIRESIRRGEFSAFKRDFLAAYDSGQE